MGRKVILPEVRAYRYRLKGAVKYTDKDTV